MARVLSEQLAGAWGSCICPAGWQQCSLSPARLLTVPPYGTALQVPRKVSHAYLAAGNRAEMLVK